jgi:hypothetical protein
LPGGEVFIELASVSTDSFQNRLDLESRAASEVEERNAIAGGDRRSLRLVQWRGNFDDTGALFREPSSDGSARKRVSAPSGGEVTDKNLANDFRVIGPDSLDDGSGADPVLDLETRSWSGEVPSNLASNERKGTEPDLLIGSVIGAGISFARFLRSVSPSGTALLDAISVPSGRGRLPWPDWRFSIGEAIAARCHSIHGQVFSLLGFFPEKRPPQQVGIEASVETIPHFHDDASRSQVGGMRISPKLPRVESLGKERKLFLNERTEWGIELEMSFLLSFHKGKAGEKNREQEEAKTSHRRKRLWEISLWGNSVFSRREIFSAPTGTVSGGGLTPEMEADLAEAAFPVLAGHRAKH